MNMQAYFGVAFFVGALLTLINSIFVFWANPRQKECRLWALLCFLVAMWQFGSSAITYCQTEATAFMFQRWMNSFSIMICPVYLHFVESLLGSAPSKLLRTGYALSASLVFLNATTSWVVPGMSWVEGLGFYERAGPLYGLMLALYVALSGKGIWDLFRARRNVSGHRRRQLDYIFAASSIGFLFGLSTFSFSIKAQLFYPGPFTSIYVLIIGYAIVRHQLMDIHVVIRQTVVYSVVSAILLAGYVGSVMFVTRWSEGYFAQPSLWISTLAAGAIALLFHPIQSRLQGWVNRHFPRESLDQDMLREATSGFVHEMKKPLATITLPAQLSLADLERLDQGLADWDETLLTVRERLRYIIDKSQQTGDVIEAVWDLSSAREMPRDPVDLRDVIASVMEQERSRLQRHQILVFHDRPSDAVAISGHAKQLEIALANVFKNAIESMADLPSGQARQLSIRYRLEGRQTLLEISDTGKGMSSQQKDRLFQLWYSTKGSQGMGIGLYLTREILRQHRAMIDVQSQEGHGTTFLVRFTG